MTEEDQKQAFGMSLKSELQHLFSPNINLSVGQVEKGCKCKEAKIGQDDPLHSKEPERIQS